MIRRFRPLPVHGERCLSPLVVCAFYDEKDRFEIIRTRFLSSPEALREVRNVLRHQPSIIRYCASRYYFEQIQEIVAIGDDASWLEDVARRTADRDQHPTHFRPPVEPRFSVST